MCRLFSRIFSFLKEYIIVGFIAVIPTFISFYVAFILLSFLDKFIVQYFPELFYQYYFPGIGLVFSVVFCFFIGFLVVHIFGQIFTSVLYGIASKFPIVRSIYSAIEKVFVIFLDKEGSYFSKVVLVEYPRNGIWSIGFITLDIKNKVKKSFDRDMYAVFIPTAPSPISGTIIYVPKSNVVPINMSVEEAFSVILSLGTLEINLSDLKRDGKNLSTSIKKIKDKIIMGEKKI